jgi:adenylate kinase
MLMQEQTFIFIGKSGCGKGTQADLLTKYLNEKDPLKKVFHLESGDRFRQFIASGDTCASKRALEINQEGGLQPEFLAIWIWSDLLIKNLCGGEHLIIDGTPRKLHEAPVLETALEFFKREKPHVVFLNVSDEWATERMTDRRRGDDFAKSIQKRLEWFKSDVFPLVEYYRNNNAYSFLEINGERSVEDIHQDIVNHVLI